MNIANINRKIRWNVSFFLQVFFVGQVLFGECCRHCRLHVFFQPPVISIFNDLFIQLPLVNLFHRTIKNSTFHMFLWTVKSVELSFSRYRYLVGTVWNINFAMMYSRHSPSFGRCFQYSGHDLFLLFLFYIFNSNLFRSSWT